MKVAIMQPYFFPYLGYFQLIKAVDKFIFYDDVNFIKRGWINRNRIIINGSPNYFTIQLKEASQNKLINEIEFTDNRAKLRKTIQMAYKKAPFYDNVWPIIDDCLRIETNKIDELASYSVKKVSLHLGIDTLFEMSSQKYGDTKGLDRQIRLQEICKLNNAQTYINPVGGMELYKKEDFQKNNINLYYLKTEFIEYEQFSAPFIPGLSIIDVLMFNSKDLIQKMLDSYELI